MISLYEKEKTRISELWLLRMKLKQGDYDGSDIMAAWLAIDELITIKKRGLPSE